jgi:jumonji domain-containing protein 7
MRMSILTKVYLTISQNDCLRQELQPLTSLFPKHIPFASEAFNAKPDAINLWVGNENSVSSMHKDHYENIFCVASGQKVFTICPPADSIFIEEVELPSGVFRQNSSTSTTSNWTVDIQKECDENGNEKVQGVRWIEADIEKVIGTETELESESLQSQSRMEYLEKFPLLRYAHPMRVYVEAGDILYLPALWYHRVTQSCETVAVNYWYDMRFDSPSWCYFNLLQQLSSEVEVENEDVQKSKEMMTIKK